MQYSYASAGAFSSFILAAGFGLLVFYNSMAINSVKKDWEQKLNYKSYEMLLVSKVVNPITELRSFKDPLLLIKQHFDNFTTGFFSS